VFEPTPPGSNLFRPLPFEATVRRPNVPDVTIQRNESKELKADGKSLMPEGLEQGMTVADMADLLSFLRQPEAALLPKDK